MNLEAVKVAIAARGIRNHEEFGWSHVHSQMSPAQFSSLEETARRLLAEEGHHDWPPIQDQFSEPVSIAFRRTETLSVDGVLEQVGETNAVLWQRVIQPRLKLARSKSCFR